MLQTWGLEFGAGPGPGLCPLFLIFLHHCWVLFLRIGSMSSVLARNTEQKEVHHGINPKVQV